MRGRSVVIVGGGLAGLAAAEAISRIAPEWSIRLLEAKRRPGGRAGSYYDCQTQTEIDYCQHAAMGCCTNLIDLLRQSGLETSFQRYRELTFLHPDHPPSRFAPNRLLPAPLHLLGTLSAQRYLSRPQQRQIKRGLWRLMRTPTAALADVRAADWLAAAGQTPDTVAAFWDVILVSALGEQSRHVSMAAARKVLIDGFASAHGACDVWIPTEPLSKLFGKSLVDALRERGVDVQTGCPVRRITGDRQVHTAEQTLSADCVISAVAWHQVAKLFDPNDRILTSSLPDLDPITSMPTSPISGIHLWFDREITSLKHAVMVGTTSQWIFGGPYADGRAEDAVGRADEVKQHYYQVVISASADVTTIPKAQLVARVVEELKRAFPAARRAVLLRHRVVTDPKSVFSIRPEVDAIRPGCSTEVPWLCFAGDWVQTGWPATMEGAVISGRMAAETLLNRFSGTSAKACRLGDLRPGWLARLLIRP